MNMLTLNQEVFQSLVEATPDVGVSILLPTHCAGREKAQDPIMLRNLLDLTSRLIEKKGVKEPESYLRGLRALQDDMHFWERNGAAGLSFYLQDGHCDTVQLESSPEPLVIVDRFLHVTHLIPQINRNSIFYLLALGQDQVRLFRCDRFSCETVEIPDAPSSMDALMGLYMQEEQLQFHTKTKPNPDGGKREAIYHGQGVGKDDAIRTKRLKEYCTQIHHGVKCAMQGANIPLLLAAGEVLAPIFRKLAGDLHLHASTISLQSNNESVEDLHQKALDSMKDDYECQRLQAVEQYRATSGSVETSESLRDILNGALYGQIDRVYIQQGRHLWGYIGEDGEIHTYDAYREGAVDLLNRAAILTLRNDGRVVTYQEKELPDTDSICAMLRYAVAENR